MNTNNKKLIKGVIAAVVLCVFCIGWIGLSTLRGEGLTVTAIKNNGDANMLITYIVTGNYDEASAYLSCDGSSDVEKSRKEWVDAMESLDMEIVSEKHSRLMTDDGITQTRVKAQLSDGNRLDFVAAVQGDGFGMVAVIVTKEDATINIDLNDKIGQAMTSWNAG